MKIKNSEEEYDKNDRFSDDTKLYVDIMEKVVKDNEWKKPIRELWEVCSDSMEWVYPDFGTEAFLSQIYKQSIEHFDIPREVQVLVDANNNLFMSVGTPGFVSFANQDDELYGSEEPMKLPIKCWIHTHPFGAAYFSGTDWNTIRTQKPILESAIVLGDMERMKWWTQEGKEMLCKTETICLNEEEE